jgi:hypothetical protein
VEYLTVAEVRDQFATEAAELSDVAVRHTIDQHSEYMEKSLGHAFGRALYVTSGQAYDVEITAQAVVFTLAEATTTYTFVDYPTLGELADAVNDADADYSIQLLGTVDDRTPCTYLKPLAKAACGPTYASRRVADTKYMYYVATGRHTRRVFLPLNIRDIQSVTENGVLLDPTYYSFRRGESWIERGSCYCGSHWSAYSQDNIFVGFRPTLWGAAPGVVRAKLLYAFETVNGLDLMQSESFIGYSYTRGSTTPDETWQAALSGYDLRPYAIQFSP